MNADGRTKQVQGDGDGDLFSDGTVTIAGLLKEFGISRSVSYELMSSGALPYATCGRKRLIPRRAVARLLASTLVGEGVR